MLRVLACLTTDHDPRLVALSALVCACACFSALRLHRNSLERETWHARFWLAATAVIAGTGIWATHFIAMLAFAPSGLRTGYDLGLTALSLGIAVGIAGAGFWMASLGKSRWMQALAGAVFGLGAVVMHYVGMAGFRTEGSLEWNAPLALASVILGTGLAAMALPVAAGAPSLRNWVLSSLLLWASVVGLHFTGMGAISIIPSPGTEVPPQALGQWPMGVATALVTCLLISASALAWLIDHRSKSEAERRISQAAFHDHATGLPNRAALVQAITAMGHAKAAILVVDLDGFARINESLGHAVGDKVVLEMARRIQSTVPMAAILAHLGRDDFAVYLPSERPGEAARALATALQLNFGSGVSIEGTHIDLAVSIGIALSPDHANNAGSLLTCGSMSLVRARAAQERVAFFDRAADEAQEERKALARDLQRAIETESIHLVYQPQVLARSGTVVGFEALARWNHPARGPVPPSDFIPLAEATGSINALGELTLRRACAEAAGWPLGLKVAVNLSPAQLSDPDLPETVARVLAETGLDAGRLELEVTETLLVADRAKALNVLRRLKGFGISIAMDDFGTGHSSLASLDAFPFDKIKIDRSFVTGIGRAGKGETIVRAVIALGQSLGMRVVAEGVETGEQLDFLRRAGCEEIQGFLFGRPLPMAEQSDLLAGAASDGKVVPLVRSRA